MQSGQHTFRVPLRAHAGDGLAVIEKVHHTRRAHNKSRGGCEGCRQRRRKCDEKRPRCSFCIKRKIECDYTPKSQFVQKRTSTEMSLNQVQPDNVRTLWPGARAPPVLAQTSGEYHTESDLYLLHHFLSTTAWSFGLNGYARIYGSKVLPLAQEYPFLMHAMIALSACHLQYLGANMNEYRIAETLHCTSASHGVRNSLSEIEGAKKSDSVLTAAMMLNALTFRLAANRDEVPTFGTIQQNPRYDWLRIQIGMTGLLMKTSPFHPDSIWKFVFHATNTFTFDEPPEGDLDQRLARFCGVDESSTSENNVYFDLVECLAPLVVRPPGEKYMVMYLRTVGAITSKIVDLLEAKDTKALLLWAHWLGLMCSVNYWWATRRTQRECWMVCAILSRKLGSEDLELLRRPAEACTFPLDCGLLEWSLPMCIPDHPPQASHIEDTCSNS